MPNGTQLAAENYVKELADKEGVDVEDMRSSGAGYDFLFHRKNRDLKIEVKGSDKKNPGIPDMRTTEFEYRRLKADYLILVHPAQGKVKQLYIIPRAAIKRLKTLKTYRVQGFGKIVLRGYQKDSLRTILGH